MIEYSRYELIPTRTLNAKSSSAAKQGMYLRKKVQGKWAYADYFPHIELGDDPVEEVLRGKKSEYLDKCLWFLENESRLINDVVGRNFRNHSLLLDNVTSGGVYKVKVMGVEDFSKIRTLLKKDITLRLDANGSISIDQWNEFLASIEDMERLKVEYIEDPGSGNWTTLLVASARDFQESSHYDYLIYKSNARQLNNAENAIFSSYMGSDLGRYHCWLELMDRGNLDLVHGIDTPGIYKEQRQLFISDGPYLKLNEKAVKDIYDDLELRSWKCLN
ncbi:MAG: hypothetical protein KC478_15800 [Bacteriovoracaceae bacterium]|nr:hypothetical protein [Bacteriovoracaceae bacterium]